MQPEDTMKKEAKSYKQGYTVKVPPTTPESHAPYSGMWKPSRDQ